MTQQKENERGFLWRCENCGKFIGQKEFDRDEVKVTFTPDTDYSVEKVEFEHKDCKKIKP